MTITKKAENELISKGYTYNDINDIEERGKRVNCYLSSTEKRITHIVAKKLLGDYDFYSGISRALNHGTAMRSTTTDDVLFILN